MRQEEFRTEMAKLLAAFPTFKPEDKKEFMQTWWEALRPFEVVALREARRAVTEGIHEFFPTLGLVLDQCRRASERLREARKNEHPTVRFTPEVHNCAGGDLSGRVVRLVGARKILSAFAPFEAVHIKCQAQPKPICPNCGETQQPMQNEFISGLMKMFPEETRDWNPAHKGNLLCPRCAPQFDSESSRVSVHAEAVTV